MNHSGIVIKSTGSWYTVADSISDERIECRLKGKIRLKGSRSTNPIVVGDIVDYQQEKDAAVIIDIQPRHNYIIRRSPNLSKESHIIAANIDRAFLVATLTSPLTNCEFIDRFLVTAEAYKIPSTIVLNKSDLYNTKELTDLKNNFIEIYKSVGYDVIEVTATKGEGVETLRNMLRGHTSLLSGNSGVGKSTLIKAIDPSLEVRIGEISKSHHKGMHTTTFSEMFPIEGGGYIIDTPGIKGFGLIDISPDEICRYFPDLFALSPECSYYNCTHTHEPSCAIKKALCEGKIAESRYISYLKLLEDDDKYRK